MVGALDQKAEGDDHIGLRAGTAERLRGEAAAMKLENVIVRPKRKLVVAYFEDELGESAEVTLSEFRGGGGEFEQFRLKARALLRQHADSRVVRKLRWNEPLTPPDLTELEESLAKSGGTPEAIELTKGEENGLGVFVRSLVGLGREAAKRAFGTFTAEGLLTANQIEFVNLVIDHLTEHGLLDAAVMYDSPFTDVAPRGPDGLFTARLVKEMVDILNDVRFAATAK